MAILTAQIGILELRTFLLGAGSAQGGQARAGPQVQADCALTWQGTISLGADWLLRQTQMRLPTGGTEKEALNPELGSHSRELARGHMGG